MGVMTLMVPPSQSKRVAEDKVMAQFSPEAMRAAEEAKRQQDAHKERCKGRLMSGGFE